MLYEVITVLSFQNALVAARIREVGARIDYHKALSSLYQAMGSTFEHYDIVAALPREGVQLV